MKTKEIIKILTPRHIIILIGILATLGTLSSLAAQYIFGMDPCVMCIQQRMALIACIITALFAYFLPHQQKWSKPASLILLLSPAIWGLYISLKQLHLQSLPPHLQPSCGAPWTFRLRDYPLFDLWEPLVRGTGQCGEIHTLFGLTLPTWSAIFFVLIILITTIGLLLRKPK